MASAVCGRAGSWLCPEVITSTGGISCDSWWNANVTPPLTTGRGQANHRLFALLRVGDWWTWRMLLQTLYGVVFSAGLPPFEGVFGT